MLKAGSLLSVIIVALLIAIICSTIIIEAGLHRQYQSKNKLEYEAIRLAENRLFLSLGNAQDTPYSEDSTSVSEFSWGVFKVIVSVYKSGSINHHRIALVGYKEKQEERYALWLKDINRPLTLVGDTDIQGKCFIPKSGIKRGYVDGISFNRSKLINGSTEESNERMPLIRYSTIEELKNGLNKNFTEPFEFYEGLMTDTIQRSFSKKTLVIEHSGLIENKYLKGKIILYSKDSLIIGDNNELNNILVYSKKIYFNNGVKVKAQFITYDSIVIGENCDLEYPSLLASLFVENNSIPKVLIGNGSIVNGFVYIESSLDPFHPTMLHIFEDAKVVGNAWVNGYVQLQGDIEGSLSCDRFILVKNSSIYENHLLDVSISSIKLSKYFVNTNLFLPNSKEKEIAEWLE
jgi:hypothetical protein